jgi:cobyrinic acid a,c-diamide synthase
MTARLLVASAGTGAGKTLITAALCALLRDRGLRVAAYKSGPDYIDARLYASVLGHAARNLDLWLDGGEGVLRHVAATSQDAEVVVIEGMMGLFDGDDAGATSSAQLARVLDASIITVLDTWTASQSAAAIALGLRAYDPHLRHLGAIVNRAGGPSHVAAVKAACERVGINVLAAIPNRREYTIGERRLGLNRAAFEARAHVVLRIAEELSGQLDVPALLSAAESSPMLDAPAAPKPVFRTRIAYAEDEAFWFTYPETLDALAAAGASLSAFSPLEDGDLPRDVGALWIGGGYPEDHAARLEANAALRRAIREAILDGVPTYAECGGLMYLAEQLHTAERTYSMVGAVEGATSMAEPRLCIGYREATVATASPFGSAGTPVRGYEFHYAKPMLASASPAYLHAGGQDGAVRMNCVAAFLHRHFLPGDPAIARFVRHSDSSGGDD